MSKDHQSRGNQLPSSCCQGKVSFEANLESARAARLVLSSRLLRLAVEVYQ